MAELSLLFMKKEQTDFHILKTIESDASVSQRKLSSQMELNVASVNFALKRLIRKGFVRMVGVNPRRIKYYVTPEGLREKTHLAYKFFNRNIHFYKEIRHDIETRIVKVANGAETSIAIYGAGELSEITYMVVSKMSWRFLGFYLEDSRITNEKIFGYEVQKLKLLDNNHPCLLMLTDEFPMDMTSNKNIKNINTLSLLNYYS